MIAPAMLMIPKVLAVILLLSSWVVIINLMY